MNLPAIQNQTQITCPQLPLAVYREVAAHLRQIEGVLADSILRPIEHQPGSKFDYYQSQIAALEISYSAKITTEDRQRIADILEYYAQRYNPWESAND